MLNHHSTTKRRVRGALKTTRKAVNRALDAAEPRLESAAIGVQELGEEAYEALRKGTRQGFAKIEDGYGQIQRKLRRQKRRVSGGKVALVAAGIAALAVGLLRKD